MSFATFSTVGIMTLVVINRSDISPDGWMDGCWSGSLLWGVMRQLALNEPFPNASQWKLVRDTL